MKILWAPPLSVLRQVWWKSFKANKRSSHLLVQVITLAFIYFIHFEWSGSVQSRNIKVCSRQLGVDPSYFVQTIWFVRSLAAKKEGSVVSVADETGSLISGNKQNALVLIHYITKGKLTRLNN